MNTTVLCTKFYVVIIILITNIISKFYEKKSKNHDYMSTFLDLFKLPNISKMNFLNR